MLAPAALAGTPAVARASDPACPQHVNRPAGGPMTFTVVERPGRRPVLIAAGVIDDGLIPRLQAAVDAFRGDEIWLWSAGGNDRIGRQAAYFLHRSNVLTRIPAGWSCSGACAFMFLGGLARTVEPGGLFIVEPAAVGAGDPVAAAQQAALHATEDSELLIRMGVSRTLLGEVLHQPGAAPRCLTGAELRRYNITNVLGGPDS